MYSLVLCNHGLFNVAYNGLYEINSLQFTPTSDIMKVFSCLTLEICFSIGYEIRSLIIALLPVLQFEDLISTFTVG